MPKSKPSKPAPKPKAPAEEKYLIANPSWAPNSWSIYLPDKHVWSSQEQTPERLVEIYGGTPTNFKELTAKGYFKDGLPKKKKFNPEPDLEVDISVRDDVGGNDIPM